MKNSHLRYTKVTLNYRRKDGTTTNISAYCDRYIGDSNQAHLASLIASDSVMSAFGAAISEGMSMVIALPESKHSFSLMENAHSWRASIPVKGRKQPMRHIVAVSDAYFKNDPNEGVISFDDNDEFVWALLVDRLGLPASPEWHRYMLDRLRRKRRVKEIVGFACSPVRIHTTREEMLEWIGSGVKSGVLTFPDSNGPITWPNRCISDMLVANVEIPEPVLQAAA
jgi:hypothetical protein